MPPLAQDAESRARYFLRLLAALCLQGGGEIVVDSKYLHQIDEVGMRQALSEDSCADGSLMLRYGSKHSAMYPVEPLSQTQTQPAPSPKRDPIPSSASSAIPAPKRPLTLNELALAERKLRQVRMAAQMRAEGDQRKVGEAETESWLSELTRPQGKPLE